MRWCRVMSCSKIDLGTGDSEARALAAGILNHDFEPSLSSVFMVRLRPYAYGAYKKYLRKRQIVKSRLKLHR